jgi:hypothetical protein
VNTDMHLGSISAHFDAECRVSLNSLRNGDHFLCAIRIGLNSLGFQILWLIPTMSISRPSRRTKRRRASERILELLPSLRDLSIENFFTISIQTIHFRHQIGRDVETRFCEPREYSSFCPSHRAETGAIRGHFSDD